MTNHTGEPVEAFSPGFTNEHLPCEHCGEVAGEDPRCPIHFPAVVQADRKARRRLSHHDQMLDAQNGCVPCKLCGGKAVISDAGCGAGYYVQCENSKSVLAFKGCLLDSRRLGGWAYNVMDWWNRLHRLATEAAATSRIRELTEALESLHRRIQDDWPELANLPPMIAARTTLTQKAPA